MVESVEDETKVPVSVVSLTRCSSSMSFRDAFGIHEVE